MFRSEKPQIFPQKDVDELCYNLAHLSVDAVRCFMSEPTRLPHNLRPAAVAEADANAGAGVQAVVEATIASSNEACHQMDGSVTLDFELDHQRNAMAADGTFP